MVCLISPARPVATVKHEEYEMSLVRKMRAFTLSAYLTVAMSVSIVGLVYCSNKKHISTDALKKYQTKTGKTIIVLETHLVGRSLSTIEIKSNGFEHNFQAVYEDRHPISDVFLVDLDGNGFDEIYIITTSAGSGSYEMVLGFA